MKFSTCITFMSNEVPDQANLQNPIEIDRFILKMNEINDYYESLLANVDLRKLLNQNTRRLISNQLKDRVSATKNQQLYCAKWEVDGRWYRVKFLRELGNNSDKAVVYFVDFGNRETVDLADILIIPDKFELFANLPYQVRRTERE